MSSARFAASILSEEHLSAGGSTNPRKLADRAMARRSILECAGKAGVHRVHQR